MNLRSTAAALLVMASAFACTTGDQSVLSPTAAANQRPPRIAQSKQLPGGVRGAAGLHLDLAAPANGIAVQDMNDGVTALQLAQALVGPGVQISNVTYKGAAAAAGLFAADSAVLGLKTGIVLSTGAAKSVIGPNVNDRTTTDWSGAGDADLRKLVGGTQTYDASVLEFDFVPDSSMIYISAYVFGSEEYNEFVNFTTNDAMAFFVNGTNCALVRGQAVSVNTVNDGYPYGQGTITNPDLYRNNRIGDGYGATINTELDGLTRVLTCAAAVTKGATNHVKLAIADVDDGLLDSDVFIGGGSITTVPPAPIPVPHAMPKFTLGTYDCATGQTPVQFDGTASYDAIGAATSTSAIKKYEWYTYAGFLGTGATYSRGSTPGTFSDWLTVTDSLGNTATSYFTVTVPAPAAPAYGLSASPDTLSVANQLYSLIAVTPSITGQCPGAPSYTVSSSQGDSTATPGDSARDVEVVHPDGSTTTSSNAQPAVSFNPSVDKLYLRAETQDSVSDRLYTIQMVVGGAPVASATVRVLHPVPAGGTSCGGDDQHGPGSAKHGKCDPDSNGDVNSSCTKDGASKKGKDCTNPANGDDKKKGGI